MTDSGPETHRDELFESPLEEFTARRNALAKRLKEEGQDEAAGEVARLKRPTLPVWALNQVARREPALIEDALAAQTTLSEASGSRALQDATRTRRDAIAAIVESAARLLTEAGHSASAQTLDRIRSTLLATTTEEERETLRAGRLEAELSASGFEDAFATLPPLEDQPDAEPDEDARRAAEDLADKARAAQTEAARLTRRAEKLRVDADVAEAEAAAAKRRAEKLEDEAAAALEALGG